MQFCWNTHKHTHSHTRTHTHTHTHTHTQTSAYTYLRLKSFTRQFTSTLLTSIPLTHTLHACYIHVTCVLHSCYMHVLMLLYMLLSCCLLSSPAPPSPRRVAGSSGLNWNSSWLIFSSSGRSVSRTSGTRCVRGTATP